MLTIASNNVDEEQLDKPEKWDLKFIRLNYDYWIALHAFS